MSRPASITSAPSDTSGATSSRSAARGAGRPRSSGPPGARAAASGTDTPSTTDTGSTPSPPRSAEPPASPGPAGSALERALRAIALRFRDAVRRFPRGFGALGAFLPSPAVDLSPRAIAGWLPHEGSVCSRCGAFLGAAVACADGCPSCAALRLPFDAARSLFAYEGAVRDAIRAAKYGGRLTAADAVALRLHEAVRGRWTDLFPDGFRPAVVPVPIRPWKYYRRGFNLPALIGLALARRAGWPFVPLVLQRARESRPQAGLPLADRAENVRGAFRAAPGAPVPPAVLLLDDVYTSGATAAACARALKRAGAESIVVVTVARRPLIFPVAENR